MQSPPVQTFSRNRFLYQQKENDSIKDIPIFAYLRRSTKNKQEISLENQADNIDLIIKKNGFEKKKVKYFRESTSAFENRKREEFTKMLEEIDRLNFPCVLLVRDPSRLSRNQNDSLKIANRLFGDNGAKKNIAKIVFYEDGEWNENSDKINVTQVMLNSYHESITTGKRSRNGVNAKLARGEYVYRNPKGISKVFINGVIYLVENEKMPFIIRAFEMKKEGITHKKISDYLYSHGIKIGERYLADTLFSNTVYIGKYIDKKTGEIFDNLKFANGKPPVSRELWEGVQKNRGIKKDVYGEKQKDFVLGGLLRTEEGRRMSGYYKKGTTQYKNTMENINASEKWIIDRYIVFLRDAVIKKILGIKVREMFANKGIKGNQFIYAVEKMLLNSIQGGLIEINFKPLDKKEVKLFIPDEEEIEPVLERLFKSADWLDDLDEKGNFCFGLEEIDDKEKLKGISDWFTLLLWINKNFKKMLDFLQINIAKTFHINTESLRQEQELLIQKLETEKGKIEDDNKIMMTNFLRTANISGMENIVQEQIEISKNRITIINEQIEKLRGQRDFDLFCARVPHILRKTFELCGEVLTDEKSGVLKEDIFDLIKLTSFELKIKKKKALEIELFGPVRQVLFGNDVGMEAPSGVEPDYGALQAPA